MARGSGQIGGPGGAVKRVIWVFIAACIAVAVFKGALTNPKQFYADLKTKASNLEVTVKRWVSEVGLTDDGSPPFSEPTPGPDS